MLVPINVFLTKILTPYNCSPEFLSIILPVILPTPCPKVNRGIANTNDRKVYYESKEMEWLETVRKLFIYIIIFMTILYLIFSNFFKSKMYKNIKVWIIVSAFIIYFLSVNILSRVTFWIYDKILYIYNNKAPRDVYVNL